MLLKTLTTSFLFALSILLISCADTSPQSYFDKTTLNTNKLVRFGGTEINNMLMQRDAGMLMQMSNDSMVKTNKLEDHLNTMIIPGIEADKEKVSKLKPTAETEEMINASLALYNYVLDSYNTDYKDIIKQIDAGAPNEEIQTAIQQLDAQKLPQFDEHYKALTDVALAYAEKNGIDVKMY